MSEARRWLIYAARYALRDGSLMIDAGSWVVYDGRFMGHGGRLTMAVGGGVLADGFRKLDAGKLDDGPRLIDGVCWLIAVVGWTVVCWMLDAG